MEARLFHEGPACTNTKSATTRTSSSSRRGHCSTPKEKRSPAISGQPAAAVQAVRQLVDKIVNRDGLVEVVNRHGVISTFKPEVYTGLVYQTAMAEATNIAMLEEQQAAGRFYGKIIGSHSVNFCTAFVDKVFYIGPGEDPTGHFPHIRTLPRGGAPFHPRCTKRYVPFNMRTATPKQIEDAKLNDAEKTLLNKPPAEAEKTYREQVRPDVARAEPTPLPAPQPAPPTSRPQEAPTPPAAPAPAALFERDRTRPVQYVGSASPEVVADILKIEPAAVEQLVHATAPGTNGIFKQLRVSRIADQSVVVDTRAPGGGQMTRTIHRDDDGKLVVHADLFEMPDALASQGIGSLIFRDMATGLQAAGVERIDVYAAKSVHFNGYYTWPRLGYNMPLQSLPRKLQAFLIDVGFNVAEADLLDLMTSAEGRKIWKKFGVSAEMVFDLAPGSKCWDALIDYLREKGRS